jgi:hypothetical protein
MKLRGSLVLAHTNTTTRSVGSFEAVHLEVVRLAPPLDLRPIDTHQPADFFLDFFLVRFGRFSVRGGVQKRHKNMSTKSPCRKLFPEKSTKISMSVFPRLNF